MQTANRNKTFTILSALSITLILLGHLNCGILTIGEMFPYYSYHVMLFVFISGYFYHPEDETNILKYIQRKAKKLLLPYFIYNLLYGILATMLHYADFSIGENVSLYNLFLAPFLSGHQFMYNATAWFVPALFLIEICNIIGRKILSVLHLENEWLILFLYLALGCMTVFLAKRGSVYEYYKLPGRILFMLPAFQFGRIYNTKLEAHDTLPSYLYFPILFVCQIILIMNNGGLGFSTVWVSGFANNALIPYLTTITGIAFWLRIAKLLAPAFGENKHWQYLGENTYAVMMHHLFVFFFIKSVFYGLSNVTSLFQDFDSVLFHSDIYYTYLPDGFIQWYWLYLILGLCIPLLLHAISQKALKCFQTSRLGTLLHNSRGC